MDLVIVAISILILSAALWVWITALPIPRETVFLATTIALIISLVLIVNVAILVLLRLQHRVGQLEEMMLSKEPDKKVAPEPEVIVVTLTPIERRILNSLEDNGGALTQDELRRATGLKKSTLSVTLSGLERKSLISRESAGRMKIVKLERRVPR